jgi:dimethylhistidine N-methyltransferase
VSTRRGTRTSRSGGEIVSDAPGNAAGVDNPVAEAALQGLLAPRKTLPPSLFYDEEGCRLFYEITKLPEYYLTRAEFRLLETIAPEVAALSPAGATLVEYGASDETKAERLLRQTVVPIGQTVVPIGLPDGPAEGAPEVSVFSTYIPIDVAAQALRAMRERLANRRPGLIVRPVTADFMRPIMLPERDGETAIMGFFPGSTIGNLEPESAVAFLRRARTTLGRGACLLLGFDTCRDPARLIPAYDDPKGITARFNRNLLVRLNREAGATFPLADPEAFAHRAVWNAAEGRIEMHLVSGAARTVMVAGRPVRFARDETIHTENSYKYAPERMRAMIEAAGWSRRNVWSDPDNLFALWLLG